MLRTTWRKNLDWKCTLWSEEMKPELFGHRDAAYAWKKKRGVQTKEEHPQREARWGQYYAVRTLQYVRKWESHHAGSNHEERRICEDQQSAEKLVLSSNVVKNDLHKTGLHKAGTLISLKMCGADWRAGSMPEDHQIWRRLRDLPKKDELELLRRCGRYLLKTTRNDCRLLSSEKETQLTISIRGANYFDPGSFFFK